MRGAWFLLRHDLRTMLRQRETILWTFLMPPLFFFFIGTITGGGGMSGRSTRAPLLVDLPPDAGFVADHVLGKLTAEDFTAVHADTVADPSRYARRLTVPAALTDSVLAGRAVTLTYRRDADEMNLGYDTLRLRRALYMSIGDLMVAARFADPPTAPALATVDSLPRTLTLVSEPAGRRRDIPTGFRQAVPGTMVMFTLLVLLTSGAVMVVIERREGLLRRLVAAPIGRNEVILGKAGARLALGGVQIAFAMALGTIVFRVDWGPDLPMLFLVLFAYGALCATLALLLGNLSRTEGQAAAIGVIASNVLAALGGCWWPIEVTPEWMQRFSLFLPTGWAMDALHNLVSFEAGAASALPHVLAMGLATAVVGWLAARTFRFA